MCRELANAVLTFVVKHFEGVASASPLMAMRVFHTCGRQGREVPKHASSLCRSTHPEERELGAESAVLPSMVLPGRGVAWRLGVSGCAERDRAMSERKVRLASVILEMECACSCRACF